jgi:putative ABC transport system permease protein
MRRVFAFLLGNVMQFHQLIRFAIGGLWRQKVRSGLTLIGVSVGACALAFSVALGIGLRSFIDNEFQGRDEFWRVRVHIGDPTPNEADVPPERIAIEGDMSEERKSRIREALIRKFMEETNHKPPVMLTTDKLAAIQALPDVREVRTVRSAAGRAWLGERSASGSAVAGRLGSISERVIAGRLPTTDEANEVVLSEFALYELGVRSDAELEAAIGRIITVDVGGVQNAQPMALARALTGRMPGDELSRTQAMALAKLAEQLPKSLDKFEMSAADRAALKMLLEKKADPNAERRMDSGKFASGEFRICGVVRILTKEERKKADPLTPFEFRHGVIFLPAQSGERLFQQLPWVKDQGFYQAEVWVKPGSDLNATVSQIEAMGFETTSALKWFGAAKREVTLIAAGLNLFAFVALFVAGVGITNTLVTSVVERTREIGILKAVGATRGQVLGIFLLEGTAIGLLGSFIGLGLARLLAIPADRWVHQQIEAQMMGQRMLTETIFEFPLWLWLAAMGFAVLVTTGAAIYPARRAARIDPILALKYE